MTKKEFVAYVKAGAGRKPSARDDALAARLKKDRQSEFESFLERNNGKQDFEFVYRLL